MSDIIDISGDPQNPPKDAGPDAPATDPHAGRAALKARLSALKTEHRQIDSEITALMETGAVDMINIRRMKKIKLSLKDKITFLENQLTPDIIA